MICCCTSHPACLRNVTDESAVRGRHTGQRKLQPCVPLPARTVPPVECSHVLWLIRPHRLTGTGFLPPRPAKPDVCACSQFRPAMQCATTQRLHVGGGGGGGWTVRLHEYALRNRTGGSALQFYRHCWLAGWLAGWLPIYLSIYLAGQPSPHGWRGPSCAKALGWVHGMPSPRAGLLASLLSIPMMASGLALTMVKKDK